MPSISLPTINIPEEGLKSKGNNGEYSRHLAEV